MTQDRAFRASAKESLSHTQNAWNVIAFLEIDGIEDVAGAGTNSEEDNLKNVAKIKKQCSVRWTFRVRFVHNDQNAFSVKILNVVVVQQGLRQKCLAQVKQPFVRVSVQALQLVLTNDAEQV
jgi:hypothetical protein